MPPPRPWTCLCGTALSLRLPPWLSRGPKTSRTALSSPTSWLKVRLDGEGPKKENGTMEQDSLIRGTWPIISICFVVCVMFLPQSNGSMLRDTMVRGRMTLKIIHRLGLKCINLVFLPAGFPRRTGFTYTSQIMKKASAPTYFGECFLFSTFLR